MEVIILRKAEEDLWSAWEHYEQIQPGLGDGFEAEVQRALESLTILSLRLFTQANFGGYWCVGPNTEFSTLYYGEIQTCDCALGS